MVGSFDRATNEIPVRSTRRNPLVTERKEMPSQKPTGSHVVRTETQTRSAIYREIKPRIGRNRALYATGVGA